MPTGFNTSDDYVNGWIACRYDDVLVSLKEFFDDKDVSQWAKSAWFMVLGGAMQSKLTQTQFDSFISQAEEIFKG